MKFLDQLTGVNSPLETPKPAMDEASLSELLANISGGKVNNADDYKRLLAAYAPPQQKRNMMSTFGDALVEASMKNPQQNNFATLGLGISGMHAKEDADTKLQQEQYRKALADLSTMAGGQRDHAYKVGQDDKEYKLNERKASQTDTQLAEQRRNNDMTNATAQASAANAAARLQLERDNAGRTDTTKLADYMIEKKIAKDHKEAMGIINSAKDGNKLDPWVQEMFKNLNAETQGSFNPALVNPQNAVDRVNKIRAAITPQSGPTLQKQSMFRNKQDATNALIKKGMSPQKAAATSELFEYPGN